MKALVAATAAALVAASAGGATVVPSLRLVTVKPLVVHGTAFRAHERVKVTATAGEAYVAVSTTAGATGAFTVSLGTFPIARCAGLWVRAVGARGSAATLKRPPLPGCMPERSP